LFVADKETKPSDDVEHQQPQLSASALLREHDEVMKAKNRLQQTSRVVDTGDSVTDNNQSKSSSAVPSSLQQSVTEPNYSQSQDDDEQRLNHAVKQKHRVPELGRGLNASCGGFVELDDIAGSFVSATVTSDTAKVCADVDGSLPFELLFTCYKFIIVIFVIITRFTS